MHIRCSCGKRWPVATSIPFRRGELSGDPGLRALMVPLSEPEPFRDPNDLPNDSAIVFPPPGACEAVCWSRQADPRAHVLQARPEPF